MKTCIIAAIGTALRASGKTMAILSIWPVLLSMLRMPAAAPRIWAPTELMMALVLGETKKPEPPPMRAMKIDNNQYGVDGPTVDNPNKPREETPRPSGVSTREPT